MICSLFILMMNREKNEPKKKKNFSEFTFTAARLNEFLTLDFSNPWIYQFSFPFFFFPRVYLKKKYAGHFQMFYISVQYVCTDEFGGSRHF